MANSALREAREAREVRRKPRLESVYLSGTVLRACVAPGRSCGSILWPGARAVGEAILCTRIRLAGARFLELGAGSGLVSALLASLGCHALATDTHALELPRATAEANAPATAAAGGSMTVAHLDWADREAAARTARDHGAACLVASDVVYTAAGAATLAALLVRLRLPMLFSYRRRSDEEQAFFAALGDAGWRAAIVGAGGAGSDHGHGWSDPDAVVRAAASGGVDVVALLAPAEWVAAPRGPAVAWAPG